MTKVTATSTSTTTTITTTTTANPILFPFIPEEGTSDGRPHRRKRSSADPAPRNPSNLNISVSEEIAGLERTSNSSSSSSNSSSGSNSDGSNFPILSEDDPLIPDITEGEADRSRPGASNPSGSSGSTGESLPPQTGPTVPPNGISNSTNGTVSGGGGSESNNSTDNSTSTDFENHHTIEEGGVNSGGGRPTGGGSGTGGSTGGETNTGSDNSGDELVDPDPPAELSKPSILLDWNKVQMDSSKFQAYTKTGIYSQTVTFQPFVLQDKKTYMLEVAVGANSNTLGKAQLYFSTYKAPKGMTCQVQPHKGYEIFTDFSIFCTSGREDLLYEFSYSKGDSSKKQLYQGRDFQYYFNLPTGSPTNDNKVTIFTEITNRHGSKTKPCPVNVTVLPSFIRNTSSGYDPDQDLNVNGMKNLSTLMLMGNYLEIRNYILLLTDTLNRLYTQPNGTEEFQKDTRNALISYVCKLRIDSQEMMTGTVSMLSDLMKVITQKYVLFNNEPQFNITTSLMDLQTTQHYGFQNTVQNTGSTKFYLPTVLDNHITARTDLSSQCYISQLIYFKENPYFWGTAPVQINDNIADLTLYNCSNRNKIMVKDLTTPIIIEFEKRDVDVSKVKPT
nr:PREDICTED: polycystic kidney disease protein 1-like 1 isoform X2 [Latimeria chalumnae]|eukprot:XP_014350612.1 PREDICTED: polycystic kidney disease protein 1-like 1 isoform X2 [Latimeria chalumnae]